MTSETTETTPSGVSHPGGARIWAFGAAAGLIASLVAWLAAEK